MRFSKNLVPTAVGGLLIVMTVACRTAKIDQVAAPVGTDATTPTTPAPVAPPATTPPNWTPPVTAGGPTSTTEPAVPAVPAAPPPKNSASVSNPYGVMASIGLRPDIPQAASSLGGSWVRVNTEVDGTANDVAKYRSLLDAGLDLIVTFENRQKGNIDVTNGTLAEYARAGFPYLNQAVWEASVTKLVAPMVPYLDQGRRIMIQSENEVGDTNVGGSGNVYWRGTTDQYLDVERALHHAVKTADPRFSVLVSSLTTKAVDALLDPANPAHVYQTNRVGRWLAEGRFDGLDLHFYGCVSQINDAAAWARRTLPAGKFWVSTENAGPTPFCTTTFFSWQKDLPRFEQVKANQVSERLTACSNGGAVVCLWFSLYNLEGEVDTFNHLGLVDRTTGAPTAAATAFARLTGAA